MNAAHDVGPSASRVRLVTGKDTLGFTVLMAAGVVLGAAVAALAMG